MHSKLLALFAFAAIAFAQTDNTFPDNPFSIHNAAFPAMSVEIRDASKAPGAELILANASNNAPSQVWHYDFSTGRLTNDNTGDENITVTAPVHEPGGDIVIGESLTQELPAPYPEDLNQVWIYNGTISSVRDMTLCMTAREDWQVIMDDCIHSAAQTWVLKEEAEGK